VYFYDAHQVLVGLFQGVGGLAILLYILLCIIRSITLLDTVSFYYAHQVLRGTPTRLVANLLFHSILYYIYFS
jgi:hypothetical protein